MTKILLLQLSILTLLKPIGEVKLLPCGDHSLTAWQLGRKRWTLDTARSPCTDLYVLTPCSKVLLNLKVPLLVKKSPRFTTTCKPARPLIPVRQINPLHAPFHFLMIHFNIILPFGPELFQVDSFPQGLPPDSCTHISSPPYMLHVLLISLFLIWSPE
jgi:hypothetical protein